MNKLFILVLLLLPSVTSAQSLESMKCEIERDTLKVESGVLNIYSDSLLNTRSQVERLVAQLQYSLRKVEEEIKALKDAEAKRKEEATKIKGEKHP